MPRLSLHDVDDATAFVTAIAEQSGLSLSWHDREDLVQFLLATCWELSLTHGWRTSFSGWVTPRLRLRVVDWQRQRFGRTKWQFHGRTHERKRPTFISLDVDDPDRARLDVALGTSAGDPTVDRSPDLAGLFAGGDRQEARDYKALGLRPPRRAA